MTLFSRDVSQHAEAGQVVSTVERSASPYFAPPFPSGMQEPGANYFTIVTADGPHTLEKPGVTGGITVHQNNRKQDPVPPLTRKGG